MGLRGRERMGRLGRQIDAGERAAGVARNASREQALGAGQFSHLLFVEPAGEGLSFGTYSLTPRRHVV